MTPADARRAAYAMTEDELQENIRALCRDLGIVIALMVAFAKHGPKS